MTIVLAVLKWFGIFVGAVFGIAVLLILLILFVPVRYEVNLEKDTEILYGFRVSFLYPLLNLKKKIQGNEIVLSVLGIPIRRFQEDKKESDRAEQNQKEESGKLKTENRKTESPKTEETKKENLKMKTSEAENSKTDNRKTGNLNRNKKKKDKSQIESGKIENNKTKKKKTLFSFEKVSGIMKKINEEENKKLFCFLWKEIRCLFVYLFPKKIKGNVFFGLEAPADTGILLGGISMVPLAYKKGLHIVPDFERKRLDGNLVLAGRMRVIYFLRLLIRLYQNDKIKKMWKKYR